MKKKKKWRHLNTLHIASEWWLFKLAFIHNAYDTYVSRSPCLMCADEYRNREKAATICNNYAFDKIDQIGVSFVASIQPHWPNSHIRLEKKRCENHPAARENEISSCFCCVRVRVLLSNHNTHTVFGQQNTEYDRKFGLGYSASSFVLTFPVSLTVCEWLGWFAENFKRRRFD